MAVSEVFERFSKILEDVKFHNWNFFIGFDGTRLYLQVLFDGNCADTGENGLQKGRKWVLSPHMTKSEVVQTAFLAVLQANEHEVREHFKYQNQSIFGPHYDVDILAGVCRNKENLDIREVVTHGYTKGS